MREFLAIVTHPRIYAPPTPLDLALGAVNAWLQAPTLSLLAEVVDYWPQLRSLITVGKIVGPRVHGARITALCRQHGVRNFWSADCDFNRFADLNVVNQLTG